VKKRLVFRACEFIERNTRECCTNLMSGSGQEKKQA